MPTGKVMDAESKVFSTGNGLDSEKIAASWSDAPGLSIPHARAGADKAKIATIFADLRLGYCDRARGKIAGPAQSGLCHPC